MINTNESDEESFNDGHDDRSSLSLCNRYKLARPMPQGKRVYFILLQFILLNIVKATNEIIFAIIALKFIIGEKIVALLILFRGFPLMLCLPMGFIADRYFGRAKVLYYSWIFLFIAQLFTTYCFIIEALVYIPHKWNYIFIFAGTFIYSIGIAGIQVNLIPFGIDQMKTASSDQLSSYFYWYYWCINFGEFLGFSICGSLVVVTSQFPVLFISSTAAAAGVIMNILCYNWFIKIEKVSNPLLLIYRVLKYAAIVKRPAERTAFSYDGRPEPSRIDLAKITHLGDFRDEEVEDVKTFLRIVVFLISLIGFLCIESLLSNVYLLQSAHFRQFSLPSKPFLNCSEGNNYTIHYYNLEKFSIYWILLLNIASVLLFILLVDRVVYPFCFVLIPSMLKRIGVGMCIGLITIICAITTEAVRYSKFMSEKSNNKVYVNDFQLFKVSAIDFPVGIVTPQFIIQAIAECLVIITMVEFIYAQSPAYMKGLLLGFLFFIEGCAMVLGSLLFIAQSGGKTIWWEYFRVIPKDMKDCSRIVNFDTGSCLSAYVIFAIVTILGILLFTFSARKYKTRVRGRALRYYLSK